MNKHTYATASHAAIDLGLSENPLGASPRVIEAIRDAAQKSHLYPDEEARLIALLAQHHGVPKEAVLLGAGANQLLEDFLKVFALGKNIVVPAATFPESVACMEILQGSVTKIPLKEDLSLNLEGLLAACSLDTRLIHLCNPNNPTGIWTETQQLLALANRSPVPLLISEAGADFIGQTLIQASPHPNLMIVRSFSKAYGLAGLRIGYAIASPTIITKMKTSLLSYRVSSLALTAAIAAIEDQDYLKKSVAYLMQEKAWLIKEMGALGFECIPSQGQTFIAKLPQPFKNGDHFCLLAKEYGIAVVNCSLYPGLERYIRISPQKQEINETFISLIKTIKKGEKL